MMRIRKDLRDNWRPISLIIAGVILVGVLLTYRLSSLTGGFSSVEVNTARMPLGWHGIYHQPLYLPLELIRSVLFKVSGHHGQLITRLPNVLMGAIGIGSFVCLIYIWHGRRTTILASLLFSCAAWTLHVSRLASFDVMFFLALPVLLFTNALIHRYRNVAWVFWLSLIAWTLLLYTPGMIWLVALNIWWLKQDIISIWQKIEVLWQKALTAIIALWWIPLILIDFLRSPHQFLVWLGLPDEWGSLSTILKNFAGVPLHLFIRGPEYPQLWLGRLPILDVFTLVVTILGLYFYGTHLRAFRSRMLFSFFIAGLLLVGLNGQVSLSLLVPLMFIWAAAGLAFLLHRWLAVFPLNPLARGLGIGLVSIAVAASCLYNLRAYFVAWSHDPITHVTFDQRL